MARRTSLRGAVSWTHLLYVDTLHDDHEMTIPPEVGEWMNGVRNGTGRCGPTDKS